MIQQSTILSAIILKLPMKSFNFIRSKQRKPSIHQKIFRSYKVINIKHPLQNKAQLKQSKSLHASQIQTSSISKRPIDLPEISKWPSNTMQEEKDHEIYFNDNKKYNYMRGVIDKYFQQTKRQRFLKSRLNPEESNKYKSATISLRQKKKINRIRFIDLRDNKDNQSQKLQSTQANSLLKDKKQNYEQLQIGKNLSFTRKSTLQQLPPIDEIYDDIEKNLSLIRYQSIIIYNSLEQTKESRIKFSQNQIYTIELVLRNGRPSHKIKTYKERGRKLLDRQLRAQSLGVEPIWIPNKYDPNSLIASPSPVLKELLFVTNTADQACKVTTLKEKQYYHKLIFDNCSQLKRVLRQFCTDMIKFEGKIINNKINTSNIYLTKDENLRLGEWGFSSFREAHVIQNMQFQNRTQPIIRSKNQWFVPPQYIAPELLKSIIFEKETEKINLGPASDIWTLGVTLFQILTLIPVWMPKKCIVLGKSMTERSGILAVPGRSLHKLLKRQQKLPHLVRKIFEQQFVQGILDTNLIEIVTKCVQFEPQNRLSYGQIIEKLQ